LPVALLTIERTIENLHLANKDFGRRIPGGTRDEMRMFDALFKGVSPLLGPLTIEKVYRTSAFHLLFNPESSFQNLCGA
jgi:hypothetical protein